MTETFMVGNVLKTAADKNILVFDVHAPSGIFTKRLISLMKMSFRNNHNKTLQFLFVSDKAIKSLKEYEENNTLTIMGVGIIPLDDSTNRMVQLYLKGIGCSPAAAFANRHLQNDQEFIVGSDKNIFNMYNDDCKCLLGSF